MEINLIAHDLDFNHLTHGGRIERSS